MGGSERGCEITWDKIITTWEKTYHNFIENGLPIDKWLSYTQNGNEIDTNDTIVKFIHYGPKMTKDNKLTDLNSFRFFASASIRSNKPYKLSATKEKNTISYKNEFGTGTTKEDVEKAYADYISPVLKEAYETINSNLERNADEESIIKAIDDFLTKEVKEEERKKYEFVKSDQVFFAAFFILESLLAKRDDFMWVTSTNSVEALEALFLDDNEKKMPKDTAGSGATTLCTKR